MREYFKKIDKSSSKTRKFREFCREHKADYYEDGAGIWIIPKKYGDNRLAFKLNMEREKPEMSCEFGKIVESCDNFQSCTREQYFYTEEAEWLLEVLPLVKLWHKK